MQSSASDVEGLTNLVGVVLRVAQMHDSSVALADLEQLLPVGMTSEDVIRAFETVPDLSGKYSLKDGLVIPKFTGAPADEFEKRQRRSLGNIEIARWLSRCLGPGGSHMVAVSGSTSYKAASVKDDVDLFCVTPADRTWLFLAKALILTRASRLLSPSRVPICLSCVMDEKYAEVLFAEERGALFARDALAAEVISGQREYERLMGAASWMTRYFPKLYKARNPSNTMASAWRSNPNAIVRFANLFLLVTVGSYIKAKARLHNRLLLASGKRSATFRVIAGPDRLIYESSRYDRLRGMYGDIRPALRDPAMSPADR